MKNKALKTYALKVGIIGVISLLLLIPLSMIEDIVYERRQAQRAVIDEVSASYAVCQTVRAPVVVARKFVSSGNDSVPGKTKLKVVNPKNVDYKADVAVDVLKRSVYRVMVYDARIGMKGAMPVTDDMINADKCTIRLSVSDFKGLSNLPQIEFGGKRYSFEKEDDCLLAAVELPQNVGVGDNIGFSVDFGLKGTKMLMFAASGENNALTMTSTYPHPSFKGDFLPDSRLVRDNGFDATWSVSGINTSSESNMMGVEFVDPANPYQQAERSIKYGILIIVLVFVAGLFVEALTHKMINTVQYVVIGLSLSLFYMLLLSFSEFIVFGWAYLIAVVMTVVALMLYFRVILRNGSAYMLGLFTAAVYVVNYILLQMQTYALLAGSLILFALLSVVMYITAKGNAVSEDHNVVP